MVVFYFLDLFWKPDLWVQNEGHGHISTWVIAGVMVVIIIQMEFLHTAISN